MARTRIAPIAGDTVIVTNPESYFIGCTGTVVRIRGQKAPYQAVIKLAVTAPVPLDDEGAVTPYSEEVVLMRDEVTRTENVTVGMGLEIERQRLAALEKRAAEHDAALTRYRAARLARYVASRVKGVMDCAAPAEFQTRDLPGQTTFLSTDPKIRGYDYFSEGITVSVGSTFGDFEAAVNWSAYGSVTPEQALKFAEALKETALRAMKLRTGMEAREGIDPKTIELEIVVAEEEVKLEAERAAREDAE